MLGFIRWRDEAGEFTTPQRWLHYGLIEPALSGATADPRAASLAFALVMVAGYDWVAVAMWRQGVVVKV